AGAGPEARGELVTRLQRKDGLGWTWVYVRLRPEGPALLAHNFVISEAEAWGLRQQLAAEAPPGPPEPFGLDFPGTDLGPGLDIGVTATADHGLGTGMGLGHGLGHGAAATADHSLGHGLGHGTTATTDHSLGHGLGHTVATTDPGLGA
ncbi:NPAS4 protein, partial [Zosterops hypoxanthus]|nr:NPAS4 protein [Zosterops hypoxanthus]